MIGLGVAYLLGAGTILVALALRAVATGAEDEQLEERPR